MTGHEELFHTIAAELDVRTPETFRHSRLGPFRPPRDLESTATRPLLVPLCRTVYLLYHAGAEALAQLFLSGGHAASAVHDLEDGEHAERLDAVTARYGEWSSGWTVVERRGPDAIVSQDGLALLARPAELAELSPAVGDVVGIRFPTSRPYRVPGWYCVISESGRPDNSDMVRLYFCLRTMAVAPVLLDAVLTELNGHRIPFEVKVVNSAGALVRNDSFVVYLERDRWEEHRQFFVDLRRTHDADLRNAHPGFALRLDRGLSFAQEPDLAGGTMSFGEHRSLLVADGLLDAFDEGAQTPGARFGAISARFAAAGLDVRAPYLNAERVR